MLVFRLFNMFAFQIKFINTKQFGLHFSSGDINSILCNEDVTEETPDYELQYFPNFKPSE